MNVAARHICAHISIDAYNNFSMHYAISLLDSSLVRLCSYTICSTMIAQRALHFILFTVVFFIIKSIAKWYERVYSMLLLLLLLGSLDIVILSPSHTVIICFQQPFILTLLHSYTNWDAIEHTICIRCDSKERNNNNKKSCTFHKNIMLRAFCNKVRLVSHHVVVVVVMLFACHNWCTLHQISLRNDETISVRNVYCTFS